jgi:hypothetical protein
MPTDVIAAILDARQDWLDIIRERLEAAVTEGELPGSTDVNALSRFYFSMVQSIGIQAHDGVPYAELVTIVDIAMSAWPVAPAKGAAIEASRVA